MHLVITDSGLGGLSVCAELVSLIKGSSVFNNSKSPKSELKITYINAVPSDKNGYNSMYEEEEKLLTFRKIVRNINKIFSPNYIFVACGTLSVLLENIKFKKDISCKIEGIIPIGTNLLIESLKKEPEKKAIIFGTPTTIFANTFQNLLCKYGIEKERIISQACPELATIISNDFEGFQASELILKYVQQSLKKINIKKQKMSLLAFLGCTHYAYRENFFQNSFYQEGYNNIKIINPNLNYAISLREIILKELKNCESIVNKISIKFVSPYMIPIQENNTVTKFLNSISHETSLAFKNPLICPELLND